MARTLLEGYVGELNEKQREMLSRIDVRSQALSEVVGDLLRLAKGRAEVATLKLAEISLRELVDEGAKLFEARAVEKGVALSVSNASSDAHVLGNREGLFSIITNLLANAVKYTPSGGRVEVKLDEDAEHVTFQVSDTGIGIPEAEQKKVFTEFYRADNAKSAAAVGTGLGLAIVKSTVEQHGGTLNLESREGEGTTFRIQFHKAPGAPAG
jgi:signal transduction histidine kinase